MNKETGELFKKLIDMFVSRENILKSLLDDRDEEIRNLKEKLGGLNSELSEIYK